MKEYILELRDRVGPDMLLQVPSVSVVARDDQGRLLMIRHVESERWLFPGGTVEPGERPADAALRETWEETGLRVGLARLVGVYGGADFVVEYRNGHRVSYVMSVFEARVEGGELRVERREALEIDFFDIGTVKTMALARWVHPVLDELLTESAAGFHDPTWRPPT